MINPIGRRLIADQSQVERLKVWLSSGELSEISLTSDTCAIGLKRDGEWMTVEATDFGKPKRLEIKLSQQPGYEAWDVAESGGGAMSIAIITKVWDYPHLRDQSQLLVMLALADYSNDHGESFPRVDTLDSISFESLKTFGIKRSSVFSSIPGVGCLPSST